MFYFDVDIPYLPKLIFDDQLNTFRMLKNNMLVQPEVDAKTFLTGKKIIATVTI